MKKDILNETFNKHTFLLKKRLYEQGVIQQQPIQEVELEEGLRDIALATLLGLGALFDMTGKADTSTTGQPTVSASSELSRVKSAKQKAEGVATEIAQRLNGGDDISKSTAKRILDDVINFNKTNKFGSKAQMDYAFEIAASNDPNLFYGKNISPRDTFELISQTALKAYISVDDSEILKKINTTVQEIALSSKDALVKKANTTDSDVLGEVEGFCRNSALGDFMQMVAEKLVQTATHP